MRDAATASDASQNGAAAGEPPDASQAKPAARDAGSSSPQAGSTSSSPPPVRPSNDDNDDDVGVEDAGAPPPRGTGSDDGPSACSARAVSDYCMDVPRLPAAPRIDGELDCGLQLQQITPVGWNGEDPMPTRDVHMASAWRSDGLYVYVEVRGSPPSPHPASGRIDCGDAVEVYVDADGMLSGRYEAPGTAQFIVAAPPQTGSRAIEAIRYVNSMRDGTLTARSVATARFDDGYAVELFVDASALGTRTWALESGASIGLDIGIDVAGTPNRTESGCTNGNQRGQYFLRVTPTTTTTCRRVGRGEPYCDDRAFCVTKAGP